MRRLPFDEILVAELDGRRSLTPDEFLAMPLHRRVAWLLERRLSFLSVGKPVDSREALTALRSEWSKEL